MTSTRFYAALVPRRTDSLVASGWRAVAELQRIDEAITRIAADVSEPHLAERIREASRRLDPVIAGLTFELDRQEPHRPWVRNYLRLGGWALLGLGGLLRDDVSDRIDLLEIATALGDAIPTILDVVVDDDLAQALAAYQIELEVAADRDPAEGVLLDENGRSLLDEMGAPLTAPRRHVRRADD